ncbi:MAG TPA: SH3 domain-containing protein [Telluria sp.]|nr:SH3 domain-containing protein [Telluria sp.]
MTFTRLIAAISIVALAPATCAAADFRTVGPQPAIFYDGPSHKAPKLYVAPQGMPVEVVLRYREWVKVRDFYGDAAWTEATALVPRRSVVVRFDGVGVYAGDDTATELLMVADRGVVLELVDREIATWVKVRHKDGITGYVKATDLWGI